MAIFQTFFFRQYRSLKRLLRNSRTKKRHSRLSKQEVPKSRKIDIIPKGLTRAFGTKMAIFPTLFFRQYMLGKCLLRYSRTKQNLSRL